MSDQTNDNPLLDFEFFAANFFKIRGKAGSIVPLTLNRAQLYIHSRLEKQRAETGKVRAIILKGRQQGCSTLIAARFCHKVMTMRGMKAYILTHEQEATTNLFEITKRYVENLPVGFCPKPDNSAANKLYFKSFDSGYSVGTAGNKAAGRSQTIQLMHNSEVAFWPHPEEHAKGVLQAVAREDNTEVIFESTANGIGNFFHRIWQSALSGESDYQAIFVPWYWQEEYKATIDGIKLSDEEQRLLSIYGKDGLTAGHLSWRRLKIAEFSNDPEQGAQFFCQEFPFTSEEAFRSPLDNAFISSFSVIEARKTDVDSDNALIMGLDPALGDKDRTALVRRRGRKVLPIECWKNHNTQQTAWRVKKIIDEEKPYKVYVDCIGIGAGVVDALHEWGYEQVVVGINVSNRAARRFKYRNKRAELWDEFKDWLESDLDVQLPDDDELHGELCNVGFWYDSQDRLQIESKEDIKSRGLPSPDKADALMLTFAGGEMVNIQGLMPDKKLTRKGRDQESMFF